MMMITAVPMLIITKKKWEKAIAADAWGEGGERVQDDDDVVDDDTFVAIKKEEGGISQ